MENSVKHIALICNPVHEKALGVADKISVLLSGMDIKHAIFTTYWPQVWDSISEAWIIGGDGTLNYFINQYPQIQLPLSVFKGGSGNDFHWMLFGDIEIEQQVEKVLLATPKMIDAGICNEKLFLNGVGIGFDGAIVKDLLGKKKLAGKASYLFSIWKHLVDYSEKECTLRMNGETITQECFLISVANGMRYGGGIKVAPHASVTDGLLDVNIVGKIAPLKRIKYLPVIEKGGHTGLPFVQYKQTTKIQISAPVALHAHFDGEYFCSKFFDVKILPKRFSFLY